MSNPVSSNELVEAARAVLKKWADAEDGWRMLNEIHALRRAVDSTASIAPPQAFTDEQEKLLDRWHGRVDAISDRLSALESRLDEKLAAQVVEIGGPIIDAARRLGVVEGLDRARGLLLADHWNDGEGCAAWPITKELSRLRSEEPPTTAPHAAGKGTPAPTGTAGQPGSSATTLEEEIEKAWSEWHIELSSGPRGQWMDEMSFTRAARSLIRSAEERTLVGLEEWAKKNYHGPESDLMRKLRSDLKAIREGKGNE